MSQGELIPSLAGLQLAVPPETKGIATETVAISIDNPE